MTATSQIIHSALCSFRETRAADAQAFLAKAQAVKSSNEDRHFIYLSEAARAFEDSDAAHAALGVEFANPCYPCGAQMVAMLRGYVGTRAEEAYERAAAARECEAIAREHYQAYGPADH
jgi:hypothetical protein